MAEKKLSWKKILILTGCFAAIALWMYMEITRWNSGGRRYFGSAELLYSWLGINKSSGMGDQWISVLLYSVSGLFGIMLYLFSTLIPERTGVLSSESGRKRCGIAATVVLAATGINMFLSYNGVFSAIFPNAGVVGSVQNEVYKLLPTLNVVLVPIAVLMCIIFAEIPSAVRNKERIFKEDTVKASLVRYVACFAVMAASITLSGALLGILNHFDKSATAHVVNIFSRDNRNAARVVTMVICAPLFEEVAFRGLMIGKMKKYIPTWIALLISSICFGLWHRNLGQFVYTFAVGLTYGGAYLATKRLRYPMFMHAATNFFSTISFSSGTGGILPGIVALQKMRKALIALDLLSGILLAVLLTAVIIALLMLLRKVGEPYSELKLKKE